MMLKIAMITLMMMAMMMIILIDYDDDKEMTQGENGYTLCPHTAVGVAFHYSVPPTIPRVNLFTSLIN